MACQAVAIDLPTSAAFFFVVCFETFFCAVQYLSSIGCTRQLKALKQINKLDDKKPEFNDDVKLQ